MIGREFNKIGWVIVILYRFQKLAFQFIVLYIRTNCGHPGYLVKLYNKSRGCKNTKYSSTHYNALFFLPC